MMCQCVVACEHVLMCEFGSDVWTVVVELLVNKPLLNGIGMCCTGFEWNKHRCTYVHWRIYSSRYLDTLLYMDEVNWTGLNMHWKCCSLYTLATIEEKGWDCSQMYNWQNVVNRITMKWEPVNLWELMCELPFHCLARSCHLEVLMVISIDSLLIKQLRKLLNVILTISLFTWQDIWRDNSILENMSSWHLYRYVFDRYHNSCDMWMDVDVWVDK